MGVGTYLERFAAKFCVEPRRECLKIFYGDPFGDIFVLNWVDQGSGASPKIGDHHRSSVRVRVRVGGFRSQLVHFFLDLDLDISFV